MLLPSGSQSVASQSPKFFHGQKAVSWISGMTMMTVLKEAHVLSICQVRILFRCLAAPFQSLGKR